ncbi:MAG: FtsQ-type POTRA domain-containing protein [Coxiellaceae bacterium]|jgi:cell division protein FtsQ|nr:FtsQ-type POTRA domain-containing protein [Coxiellaceae bacterium]
MQPKSQNKKYIRKVFFTIVILGIGGILSWCIWNFTQPIYFPINHIKIFATYEHIKQGDLQKTISSYTDRGFFHLNVKGMKQQLLKSPWIYAVSVQREWPDIIKINIVEQHPILQWGKNALINSAGIIFTPSPITFPKELPIIFGPEEKEAEIFALYQKILLALEPLDLTLKKLILNSTHYWEILLNNNTVVYMKEAKSLNQIELLTNVYRKITADRVQAPKSIDLRYQSGLAVKWE